MATKIPFAFASDGDTENVPASSAGTELSWLRGWSPAYELSPEDTGYRFLSRGQHNLLWNVITANIKEWQDQIYPAHNSTIDYPVGSIVRFDDVNYIRISGSGITANPSISGDWSTSGQFTSVDKAKLDSIEAGAKTQIWSANNNYVIGEEVAHNDLRYIAQSASGPANGGAVTPTPVATAPWLEVPKVGTRAFEFLSVPIGTEMAFDTPPPTNDPRFRFVKLTADDAYNDSLLNNKIISGTSPNLIVKMTINSSLSPINEQQVSMLNTMGAIHSPAETSGVIIQDAIRNLTGEVSNISKTYSTNGTGTGVFVKIPSESFISNTVLIPGSPDGFNFDASRQVPTDDRVQVFAETRIYYKRIY